MTVTILIILLAISLFINALMFIQNIRLSDELTDLWVRYNKLDADYNDLKDGAGELPY